MLSCSIPEDHPFPAVYNEQTQTFKLGIAPVIITFIEMLLSLFQSIPCSSISIAMNFTDFRITKVVRTIINFEDDEERSS